MFLLRQKDWSQGEADLRCFEDDPQRWDFEFEFRNFQKVFQLSFVLWFRPSGASCEVRPHHADPAS